MIKYVDWGHWSYSLSCPFRNSTSVKSELSGNASGCCAFRLSARSTPDGFFANRLQARFSNCPHEEIRIAALEQQKITELRLEKLLAAHAQSAAHPSEGTVLLPTPTATTSQTGTESASRVVWPHDEGRVLETRPGTRRGAHGRLAQIGDHLTAGRGPGALSESRQGETLEAGASLDKSLNCEPHRLSMQPAAGAAAGLRSPITTHVLDLSHGRPAHGVAVELQVLRTNSWLGIGQGETDADGRVVNLMAASSTVAPGVYKLRFETGAYLRHMLTSERGDPGRVGADGGFYPLVEIVFEVKSSQTQEHFHVPLILSPYSYTTYRGS
jgi:5-hydroxyisourate hydrolase